MSPKAETKTRNRPAWCVWPSSSPIGARENTSRGAVFCLAGPGCSSRRTISACWVFDAAEPEPPRPVVCVASWIGVDQGWVDKLAQAGVDARVRREGRIQFSVVPAQWEKQKGLVTDLIAEAVKDRQS